MTHLTNEHCVYASDTTRIGGPQDSNYRRLKPHYIFAVVCGKDVTEVIAEAEETKRAKRAIQTDIPYDDEEVVVVEEAA